MNEWVNGCCGQSFIHSPIHPLIVYVQTNKHARINKLNLIFAELLKIKLVPIKK